LVVSNANGGAIGGSQRFSGLQTPATTPSPSTSAPAPPEANRLTGLAAAEPLVAQTIVGADGSFALDQVPSPSEYDLIVSKDGFASAVQRVTLGGGENRGDVNLMLKKGDGLISGHVFDSAGGLGGVTITASAGSSISGTVSLTQDDPGAFTLRNLTTPGNYTVLFAKDGYTTQTLSLTLSAAQQLTGVVATLSGGSGSVHGLVVAADAGHTPVAGVSVVVTNGAITLQTATLSVPGLIGRYQLSGLPMPGTYTITFSGAGLAPVTQAFELDPFRAPDATVDATMPPAAGTVEGLVAAEETGSGVGEVNVSLSNGASTFNTVSATIPAGRYQIGGVPPGTYTLTFNRRGAQPVSDIVNVGTGTLTRNPVVGKPARIHGTVFRASDHLPLQGAQVRLYILSQYPNQVFETELTGADGTFSFDDPIAPESYIVDYTFPLGAPAQASRLVGILGAGADVDLTDPHIELTTG
jgi:hypothetical protein